MLFDFSSSAADPWVPPGSRTPPGVPFAGTLVAWNSATSQDATAYAWLSGATASTLSVHPPPRPREIVSGRGILDSFSSELPFVPNPATPPRRLVFEARFVGGARHPESGAIVVFPAVDMPPPYRVGGSTSMSFTILSTISVEEAAAARSGRFVPPLDRGGGGQTPGGDMPSPTTEQRLSVTWRYFVKCAACVNADDLLHIVSGPRTPTTSDYRVEWSTSAVLDATTVASASTAMRSVVPTDQLDGLRSSLLRDVQVVHLSDTVAVLVLEHSRHIKPFACKIGVYRVSMSNPSSKSPLYRLRCSEVTTLNHSSASPGRDHQPAGGVAGDGSGGSEGSLLCWHLFSATAGSRAERAGHTTGVPSTTAPLRRFALIATVRYGPGGFTVAVVGVDPMAADITKECVIKSHTLPHEDDAAKGDHVFLFHRSSNTAEGRDGDLLLRLVVVRVSLPLASSDEGAVHHHIAAPINGSPRTSADGAGYVYVMTCLIQLQLDVGQRSLTLQPGEIVVYPARNDDPPPATRSADSQQSASTEAPRRAAAAAPSAVSTTPATRPSIVRFPKRNAPLKTAAASASVACGLLDELQRVVVFVAFDACHPAASRALLDGVYLISVTPSATNATRASRHHVFLPWHDDPSRHPLSTAASSWHRELQQVVGSRPTQVFFKGDAHTAPRRSQAASAEAGWQHDGVSIVFSLAPGRQRLLLAHTERGGTTAGSDRGPIVSSFYTFKVTWENVWRGVRDLAATCAVRESHSSDDVGSSWDGPLFQRLLSTINFARELLERPGNRVPRPPRSAVVSVASVTAASMEALSSTVRATLTGPTSIEPARVDEILIREIVACLVSVTSSGAPAAAAGVDRPLCWSDEALALGSSGDGGSSSRASLAGEGDDDKCRGAEAAAEAPATMSDACSNLASVVIGRLPSPLLLAFIDALGWATMPATAHSDDTEPSEQTRLVVDDFTRRVVWPAVAESTLRRVTVTFPSFDPETCRRLLDIEGPVFAVVKALVRTNISVPMAKGLCDR